MGLPKQDLFRAIRDINYKDTERTFHTLTELYHRHYPDTGYDILPFGFDNWDQVERVIIELAERLGK